MIAYLAFRSLSARVMIWTFDACRHEKVLFEASFTREDGRRQWGVRITWCPLGDDRTLAWWLYRDKKQRGWCLQGPLRRIA